MNFEFSDDQQMLREQARKFLREQCSPNVVRSVLDDPACSHSRELWNRVVELGWTAVAIPEVYGGLGLGYLELCVIAEELGRCLAPTPYSSSVYLATEAIKLFGSESQKQHLLPRLAAGDIIGTFAVAEESGFNDMENLTCELRDEVVYGEKVPVFDADIADFAVVLVKDGDAASLVLCVLNTESVTRRVVESLDPTRSQALLGFSATSAEVLGKAGSGWEQVEKLFSRAAILFAFEQVGGAQASLDMAREYALQRYAFGRPIASFQAIKHKLADMYIAITLAHSNCYFGAWALSTGAEELPLAAATARVSATNAFNECSRENIQTHGGMGYTWEFDCHLYFRRAKALSVNLGGPIIWQEKLVTALAEAPASAE